MLTRRTLLAATSGALAVGVPHESVNASDLGNGLHQIKGRDAQTVGAALSQLTTITVGTGRPITAFMSSLCPVCHAFMKKYPGLTVPGIAMRYAPVPLGELESGAVHAALARPDIDTFRRFMTGAFRSAAPVKYNPNYSVKQPVVTPSDRYSRQVVLVETILALFRRDNDPNVEFGTPRFLFTHSTDAAVMARGTPNEAGFATFARIR